MENKFLKGERKMETIYTVKDVAYMLGVNKDCVLRWIRKGELTCYKIKRGHGIEFRVTESMLEEFMANHQSKRAAAKLERSILKQQINDRLSALDEVANRVYEETCFLEELRFFVEEMDELGL